MKTGAVALAISALALGLAGFALTKRSPSAQRAPMHMNRIADLERDVAELTRELESLRAERPRPIRPAAPGSPWIPSRPDEDGAENPPAVVAPDGTIEAIVDAAVDRKAEQVMDEMRVKGNKRPALDAFASVLELTDEQRASAERVIVDGQNQVHAILDRPTADGTNLMDELVEIFAQGMAAPGEDHGFGRWIGRVLIENIPGTSETYGARIETVKSAMRATFKREWSEEQYREFEEWGIDPTEIQNVPGSPNDALGKRIAERARTLGADLPEDD